MDTTRINQNSVAYGNGGLIRQDFGEFLVIGTLSPGDTPIDSIGTFSLIGDLNLSGETRIEIASANSHDFISVQDNIEIAFPVGQINVGQFATLVVALENNFIPQNSDVFTVIQNFILSAIEVEPAGTFVNTTANGRIVVEDGTGSFAVVVDNGAGPNGGQSIGSHVSLLDFQSLILGDVNGDGVVNLLDVAPFVTAISNGTYSMEADINIDGVVNLLDVNPFIDILSN